MKITDVPVLGCDVEVLSILFKLTPYVSFGVMTSGIRRQETRYELTITEILEIDARARVGTGRP